MEILADFGLLFASVWRHDFRKSGNLAEKLPYSAPANPKSGHFPEIRSSPAPAKFLAGFARCQSSCSICSIYTETNTDGLSGGVFAILLSVIQRKKIQSSFPFHQFHQNLANSDVTKEALNCTVSL